MFLNYTREYNAAYAWHYNVNVRLRQLMLGAKTSLIEAEWHIYTSVQHANIVSDNGLSPVRRQAIIWTNTATLTIRP